MLKAIGFVLKTAAFALLVLMIGNWARWDGRTLSEQVRLQLSRAERTDLAGRVRGWAERLTGDARQGFRKKAKAPRQALSRPAGNATAVAESATLSDETRTTASAAVSSPGGSEEKPAQERIDSSERQKLKALIRELNSSHGRD